MFSLAFPVLGSQDLGSRPRNRCLLICKITRPKSYIGSPVTSNPFVEQGLHELGSAIGAYFRRHSAHAVSAMGDPFILSKGKCGRFLLVAARICVSNSLADTLDRAAGPRPARGGIPGKPAGVLAMKWGSSGSQVELQWENREAPATYRASGFPYAITAEILLGVLREANLQVFEVSSPISPTMSLPMHGVNDISFEAGAKAPSHLEFPVTDGAIRKCQLCRVTRASPAPPSGVESGCGGPPRGTPISPEKAPSPPTPLSPPVTWATKLFPGSRSRDAPPSSNPDFKGFQAGSVPDTSKPTIPRKRIRGNKSKQAMAANPPAPQCAPAANPPITPQSNPELTKPLASSPELCTFCLGPCFRGVPQQTGEPSITQWDYSYAAGPPRGNDGSAG